MKNKINLVLDLSNLFYRSLSSANGYGSFCSYETQDEINQFIKKLSMDVSYILRMFKPGVVIFAIDDKPWRKEILKTLDVGYKGSRVKNDKMNWDKIYKAFDDFKEILKDNKFIVNVIKNAEADDLAALWKDELYSNRGENVIIISSDADLRQLVSFNEINNNFCLVFNPISNGKQKIKKLYCTESFNNWINKKDEVDIFFSNFNLDKNYINALPTFDKKIKLDIIDPNMVVLNKIFCGDDGDDIPAFYEFYNESGKKTRITPAKFAKIIQTLNIKTTNDLNSVLPLLQETIEKVLNKKINDIDFEERLLRQRKLVELDKSLFPIKIVDDFNKLLSIYNNYEYVDVSNYKLDKLLEGSSYLQDIKKEFKAKESSIFKDLEKYIITDNVNGLFNL